MLIDRFKKYLEQQFRAISPTKEAMEYREEVLQNLLDRAQEYKIKGMTDEDAIYDLCIDSLGKFKDTLVDFENRLDNVKRAVPRIGARVLTGIAIALFVIIGYLSVSFATRAWDKTWLILVGGAFMGITAGAIFGIIVFANKKRRLAVRGLSHIILALAFTFIFLILQILVRFQYSWMTFLVMVVAMLITDTAEAYSYGSKTRLIDLLATVEVMAVMVYVMLGVTHVIKWSPWWLLPVGAALVDVIILIVSLLRYSKKKEKAIAEKKARIDEAYYTMWNDENK